MSYERSLQTYFIKKIEVYRHIKTTFVIIVRWQTVSGREKIREKIKGVYESNRLSFIICHIIVMTKKIVYFISLAKLLS